MPRGTALLVALACLLGTVSFVASQATKYSKGDHVPLFANKVHLNFPTWHVLGRSPLFCVYLPKQSREKRHKPLGFKTFRASIVPLFTL